MRKRKKELQGKNIIRQPQPTQGRLTDLTDAKLDERANKKKMSCLIDRKRKKYHWTTQQEPRRKTRPQTNLKDVKLDWKAKYYCRKKKRKLNRLIDSKRKISFGN